MKTSVPQPGWLSIVTNPFDCLFPVGLEVLERYPGIHQGGDAPLAFVHHRAGTRQAGEHGGNPLRLADVGETHENRVNIGRRPAKSRDRIDHDDRRLEPFDVAVHPGEMHLEPVEARPCRLEAERIAVEMRLEVDSHRTHVADDLVGRFLEGEVEASLAAAAGRVHERGAERRFSRPREAGNQHAGAAVIAAKTKHRVETGDARRHRLLRDRITEAGRGDRHHADPLVVDQERIFVRAVGRAAVLDDAQSTGRDLVLDPVVEQDDAVRDIFLDAVPGQLPIAAFAGDDGGDALVLQPGEQPAQLRTKDRRIGKAGEEGLEPHPAETVRVKRITRNSGKILVSRFVGGPVIRRVMGSFPEFQPEHHRCSSAWSRLIGFRALRRGRLGVGLLAAVQKPIRPNAGSLIPGCRKSRPATVPRMFTSRPSIHPRVTPT